MGISHQKIQWKETKRNNASLQFHFWLRPMSANFFNVLLAFGDPTDRKNQRCPSPESEGQIMPPVITERSFTFPSHQALRRFPWSTPAPAQCPIDHLQENSDEAPLVIPKA
jgi:hypothetical protein